MKKILLIGGVESFSDIANGLPKEVEKEITIMPYPEMEMPNVYQAYWSKPKKGKHNKSSKYLWKRH